MKWNSIKIVSAIGIIIIATYTIYNIYIRMDKNKISNEYIDETEKVQSDELRIGIVDYDTINPIFSDNIMIQNISRIVYEPLLRLTEDYRLEENLISEYISINKNTYLIKLRNDIKWQDGSDFTSDDVIFTVKAIKNKKNNSIYFYNVENIKEIKKIDEYTLKIVTDQVDKYFEYNLIFPIISSKQYAKGIKKSSNDLSLGTGMYYVAEINNERIILKKNINYWKQVDTKINNITLKLYQNLDDAIEAVEINNIDLFMSLSDVTNDEVESIQCSKIKYIGRKINYIGFNTEDKITKDKNLRIAISKLINKEHIIEKAYNNNYIESQFPLDFGSYIYNKRMNLVEYNEEEGKKILKKSNYKKQLITLLVNKENKNMVAAGKLIKDQLESNGIQIKLMQKSKKEYEKRLERKKYQIALMENTYGYSPSLEKYFGKNNIFNYIDKKNISNLEKIKDDENLINNIVNKYTSDIPFISLYYNTETILYSKNLKGKITPNSYNIFYSIEDWYREYDKK